MTTPRFEVDYKQRLEQSRESKLPRFNYKKYRIYEEEIKTDKAKTMLNQSYGLISGGVLPSRYYQYIYKVLMDDLAVIEPQYTVQWLKPKQATLLRLQGKRVEEEIKCSGTKQRRTKKK